MTDVDTSSYLKPQAQPSLLDTVGKFQGLEAQKIGIDQAKLKLVNDRYGVLNKELSTLISDPNVDPQKIIDSSQNLVKLGLIPADMHAKFISQIPTNQQVQQNPNAVKNFLERTLTRSMTTQEAINFHYGAPGTVNNGQVQQPVVTSPKFGVRPVGPGFQNQLGPETPVATPGGTQLLGPQSPQAPPGASATPPLTTPGPQAIQQPRLPVAAPDTTPIVPRAVQTVQTSTPVGAPQTPSGPMASQAPLFESGKNMLAEDQALATNKLTAIKPALQALPLMKELSFSGPLTGKITEISATLKNLGIIPTYTNNDKTAVTQEVIKKMYQYLSSNPNGQRSDASQILAEAGSPNPNVQILPALIKLTKDTIILDRVQAARAGAFSTTTKDALGNEFTNQRTDLHNYGQHRSTFPASVDERAFGLDFMEPKERTALLTEMKKKANTFEGKKFWKTLSIVDRQGLINTNGQ